MKVLRLIFLVALCGCGCGRAKRAAGDAANSAAGVTKTVAAKTGKVVGEHVGTFFAGIGEGVEVSLCDYAVRIEGATLEAAGLSSTLVQRVSDDTGSPALSFYLVNAKPVSGTLRLRLLTEDGSEIGRAETTMARGADAAGYVRFALDKDLPTGLVRTAVLSLAPSP